MKTELVKITTRIPNDILDQVRELADAHHRSMNGEIIAILEEYLKSHQDVSEEQQPPKN